MKSTNVYRLTLPINLSLLMSLLMSLSACSMLNLKKKAYTEDKGLQVIISPKSDSYRHARAGLVFFTPYHPSKTLAAECNELFKKAFLKHKVFKIIEPCSAPESSEEELMALAEGKGYDLLVQGRLTDFFLAYGPETSRAGVSIKVYDLKRRVTLWYIEAVRQVAGQAERDWILWKREQRDPPSPYLYLAHMAEEMAGMMAAKSKTNK